MNEGILARQSERKIHSFGFLRRLILPFIALSAGNGGFAGEISCLFIVAGFLEFKRAAFRVSFLHSKQRREFLDGTFPLCLPTECSPVHSLGNVAQSLAFAQNLSQLLSLQCLTVLNALSGR